MEHILTKILSENPPERKKYSLKELFERLETIEEMLAIIIHDLQIEIPDEHGEIESEDEEIKELIKTKKQKK